MFSINIDCHVTIVYHSRVCAFQPIEGENSPHYQLSVIHHYQSVSGHDLLNSTNVWPITHLRKAPPRNYNWYWVGWWERKSAQCRQLSYSQEPRDRHKQTQTGCCLNPPDDTADCVVVYNFLCREITRSDLAQIPSALLFSLEFKTMNGVTQRENVTCWWFNLAG